MGLADRPSGTDVGWALITVAALAIAQTVLSVLVTFGPTASPDVAGQHAAAPLQDHAEPARREPARADFTPPAAPAASGAQAAAQMPAPSPLACRATAHTLRWRVDMPVRREVSSQPAGSECPM